MKRILFCAAVAALATACTNEDDLVLNQDNSRTQGLTFDVALAEGATTRGELTEDNGTYPFFWYAETDRINVYASNVVESFGNTQKGVSTIANNGVWTFAVDAGSALAPSIYKATLSEAAGKFTSASDDDELNLKDFVPATPKLDITSNIIATYGTSIAVEAATSEVKDNAPIAGKLKELSFKLAANAAQTLARANNVQAPMYSVSSAKKDEVYHSLGERAQLRLIRPLPLLRFTTKNTADFIKDFGKLKTVELTALGNPKDAATFENVATLSYAADEVFTVIGETPGFDDSYAAGSTPEKVTVTLTDGTWTDNDAVYMTVAPVDRKKVREAGKKELLKVVYTFDNITFTLDPSQKGAKDFEKALQTDSNWTALTKDGQPNGVISVPALDINNYDFLVTDNQTSNEKALIVLKGNFKDVFKEDGNINWGTGIDPKDITKIVSNVELTDAEIALIATKFDDTLVDITLKENTSIPAKTFTTAQAAAMKHINLPKVTSIDLKFIDGKAVADANRFKVLETISMPAYAFEPAETTVAFFNTDVASTLEKADISAVNTMLPKYGILRTLAFTDYAVLEEITVMDGVAVTPNGFAGCKVLETINGKLDISAAPEVFKMAASANDNQKLKSVEITGTEIPAGAFINCSVLETVLYNGAAIVPTAIGKNAFENTAKIEYMDLSKAATIGNEAFKASGIKATKKGAADLVVGVKSIASSVFENCAALEIIKFTEATVIEGEKALNGTTKLAQVKFQKVFTLAENASDSYYDTVFGGTARDIAIHCWTNPEQPGVSGMELTLSYKTGDKTSKDKNFKFASIQKKLD